MIGSVLLGLLDGLDVALLAIGLVLIFRSGRFIIFACVIGGLSEFLLIRRLSKRSRFTVMVATIGLSQFLLAWTYFPWLPPPQREMVSVGYPMPFNVSWTFQNLPIF